MKLPLVDSHAHLFVKDFADDLDEVINRAGKKGLTAILTPVDILDPQEIEKALNYSSSVLPIFLAAGAHPHQAHKFNESYLGKIESLARKKKIVAIGEIGLDYYYNFSSPDAQKRAFYQQLILAEDLKLPVIIHSRQAAQDVLSIVKKAKFSRGGVLHCFTENYQLALEMMEQGFFISFSGIITFPNAQSLREIAVKIPLENLLAETDSPYLTPHPLRKKIKRNEPAFIFETVNFLAQLKKTNLTELVSQLQENFQKCFGLEDKIIEEIDIQKGKHFQIREGPKK